MPRPRPNLVVRQALSEHLDAGAWRPFTLVSAPAGFGKTTLISDWIARGDRPAAWISLDAKDNDPYRFLSYFVAALQQISDKIDGRVLDELHERVSVSLEEVLTDLVNQVALIAEDFTFVLDDYHEITNLKIHDFVNALLDGLPPQMHLVVTTRADPPFQLSRMRARGEINEIREAELKFTKDESRTFFDTTMAVELSDTEVAILENRTEGWVAGLQLAAISMKSGTDINAFVSEFAGDDRHILDFLVDEVLEHQPKIIQDFLLDTSVLDRLTGGLCDAVTGRSDGNSMLRELDQNNLFIIPLDDKREWYRYHHLFAEMLRSKRAEEQPDWNRTAHDLASEWHESQGSLLEAVDHALEAENFERACELLVSITTSAFKAYQHDVKDKDVFELSALVDRLPKSLVYAHPTLGFLHVWWFYHTGQERAALDNMPRVQDEIERITAKTLAQGGQVDARTAEENIVVIGEMALFRATFALNRGDFEESAEISREVIFSVPEGHRLHTNASKVLGRAYWSTGDVSNAIDVFSPALSDAVKFGLMQLELTISADLGRQQQAQGKLREASDTYQQVLDRTKSLPDPIDGSGYVDVLMGLSELHRQRNQFELADQAFNTGLDVSKHSHNGNRPYDLIITLARMKKSQGLFEEAIELAEEAKKAGVTDSMTANTTPADVFKASVYLALGEIEQASLWREASHVTVHDAPVFFDEFAHITLAKTLIAEAAVNPAGIELNEVLELIDRVLRLAEDQGRSGSMIEIFVVQALTHQTIGNKTDAAASIERALTLAEPEGYVRVFLDEGDSIRNLLRQIDNRSENAAYAQRLIAAFGHNETEPDDYDEQLQTGLIDPLSSRELEVLALIISGMTNQGIADQLFITLDTVKRHVTHIYSKMDVDRRPQAVTRAQELGLV